LFRNCYTKKCDVLPDDGPVRSETCRSVIFKKYKCERHDSCVDLLVKTVDVKSNNGVFCSEIFSTREVMFVTRSAIGLSTVLWC
jgi:hypothetical protein